MNLIPMIAKELGVEVGEEFQIDFRDDKKLFMFSETALLEKGGKEPIYRTLADLVYGVRKIIKLPFEPKNGDKYFRIFIHSDGDINVCSDTWMDWTTDYMCKYCGNCFRSEAEAKAHKQEIYEKLTGREWEHESTD